MNSRISMLLGRASGLFVPMLLAYLLLIGCAAKVSPPYTNLKREGNALLSFRGAHYQQLVFFGDGDGCSDDSARSMRPEELPHNRPDETLVVQPDQWSAFLTVWTRGLSACHVITAFKLAPDGRYRFVSGMQGNQCYTNIVADAENVAPPQIRQMKWKLTGGCAVAGEK